MFRSSLPRSASRRLIAAFVLLLLLPAATVVGLGVRLITQDQQIESGKLRKRQEGTAEQVATLLEGRLAASERNLALGEPPGDEAVMLVLRADRVETRPATGLIYRPGLGPAIDGLPPEFVAGEALEHRGQDLDAAEAVFRKLTVNGSSAIRAGALVRLARVLRKRGRRELALHVYDDLARLRDVRVDGVPADLVARRARIGILNELKQTAKVREEAPALGAGLVGGAWEIDRGTFQEYQDEVASWLGSAPPVPPMQQALAEAAAWLWDRRGTSGRSAVRFAGVDLVLLWRASGDETLALVAGPAFQQRQWFREIRTASIDGDLHVGLTSAAGPVFGAIADAQSPATLRQTSVDTHLPWDILVTTDGGASVGSSRRLAILIGLGFLVLLVIAGGYVMARAVARELAVARLQADFVASVSHEFRTPLTSLRQFTDLLSEAEDLTPDKRRQFYAAQARATERLQRLVESLLDFRRMEAGTHPYQRRRLSASELVEGVVHDFRPEAAARGFDVDYAHSEDTRAIDADADALSLALWNLLDNAVKYSGDSRRVAVSLAGLNGSIEIRVRDSGLGVPREEQREIFRQFVRGRDARARGIKGTGIGLAMVHHIVHGHGGRVAVESTPGEGSTFTIVLPAAKESV